MWGELSWGEFSLGQVVLGRVVFGASYPDPENTTGHVFKNRKYHRLAHTFNIQFK